MNGEEAIKVTLELPKQIADFIKDSWATENLQETLTKDVINLCFSQLEADANEKSISSEELIKKYGLLPVFKQFGVLPCYIKEVKAE